MRVQVSVRANMSEGGSALRLVLEMPAGWPDALPGQFLMLHLGAGEVPRHDPLLPRPMAIYRTRRRAGEAGCQIEVLYKVVGRGTGLLSRLGTGDTLGAVGPLGRPFPLPDSGERSLLVGGGTGIASLYDLARCCRDRGDVSVLLGAASRTDLMGLDDFAALGVELRLASEDGSAGTRGLVTTLLEDALAAGAPARVYSCGPTAMMQRCARIAEDAGARCYVSLENHMACGFGVCLGCAVPRAEQGFHLVCRDGPVFETSTLDMAGLP